MTETLSIPDAPYSTMSDVLDEYLAMRQISKKKYFVSYMIAAKQVWQEIFQKTIWVVKNEWHTIQKGDPFNFVYMPKDCSRFFSASVVDHCGDIVPIYYNSSLNVIPRPKEKKCGCSICECGGLCEELNSTVLTTKVLFTINGQDYIEKCWIKYCTNGDIIQWCEVPVKKYNDFPGSPGDYNVDFNNDFLIGSPPFSNYSVVTETFQTKLCKLDTLPCGCPADTDANEDLILQHCGCFLPFFSSRRKKHCEVFQPDINYNCRGEIKMSECGNKIYYRPNLDWHRSHNTEPAKFLLLNYQTNGLNCTQETQVPQYAKQCLWTGVDFYTKKFNNKYSPNEKLLAKYEYNHEQNELIKYLSPISLEWLGNVQDAAILW